MKAYGVLLPLRHLVNKRSELSRSYSSHAPENDFVFRSAYASGAAPTHPYIPRRPAVNVFQGGTLPPPPLPPSHPNFSSPTHPLTLLLRRPFELTEPGISALPPRERTFLSLSRFLRSARSSLPLFPFVLPPSLTPASVGVLRSATLFVLEIRRGLPDPPFSCAVINYYLLAIHPRTRYPRKGCDGGN